MTLRCKPGDLAFITFSDESSNIGALVEVVSFVSNQSEWFQYFGEEWEIKPITPLRSQGRQGVITSLENAIYYDKYLRPIRDQPGQDESLTWTDVPRKVDSLNSV